MRSLVKTALVFCVAFFVALRVVAHPLILSAPAPGVVALCSNGQIIYISLETGQPVETENQKTAVACPYAGQTALGVADKPDLDFQEVRSAFAIQAFSNDQLHTERRVYAHAARAPPVFV